MARAERKSRAELIREDLQDLHRLGYAQQLLREMGGFSNFAVSFSIISVLTGAILLFGFGLRFAGPIVNTVGWPLVSCFVLVVAASMAELASAYPTAGGLYFWAHRLGGRGWAWTTAWLNMIGQVTITAGINIAAAIYLVGGISRFTGQELPTNWYFYVFVMVLIMVPQIAINVFGIRLTARLGDFSVWWHIGGVVVIALLLTVFGKTHQPLEFAFQLTTTTNPYDFSSAALPDGTTGPALAFNHPVTGQPLLVLPSPLFALLPFLTALYQLAPTWLVFAIALLQAQWTYTGFDASAHVAEETVQARLSSAWGVFLSVAVSAVVGYLVLLVLTLSITDVAATAVDPYPVLKIAWDNLPPFGANLVAVIVAVAMWLCGLSSITSMSRMWFAFARDGGMPGHTFLRKVHPRYRTPVGAILVTSGLAVVILLWSGAFYVVTAISVAFLYWAYGIPIFLNLRNKLRGRGENTTAAGAPWSLGRFGPLLNVVAVVWIAGISVLLVLPPNELALWTSVSILGFLPLYWFLRARRRFAGPQLASQDELRRVEALLADTPHSTGPPPPAAGDTLGGTR
jgi:amino acid transporter